METRNFYAGMLQLNEHFGITMLEEDYENMALHAWDHIGNKNYLTYTYKTKIENHRVQLPCNVNIVEAVMRFEEDIHRTEGVNDFGVSLLNTNLEAYVEAWKIPGEPLYSSGGYMDYEQKDQTLYFKVDKIPVHILYKGVIVDELGLPLLNFKEVDAIAKYCAWIVTQKQAMITRDQATFQIAQMMRQQWQSSCDDARTPIYLNQNDMDRLLNVQSSWDRKRFGISYKPLR
jgi:hypothetical protein